MELQERPFEERRRASRFPRDEETEYAAVWLTPSEEMIAVVHDESLGGLSLIFDDASPFPLGREVGIVYTRAFLRATVKHVSPRAGGGYVVGFETRNAD